MKGAQLALAVAAWLAASGAMPAHAQKTGDAAAKALVTKALQASDIEAKGSPAFRLQARIGVDFGQGLSGDGKYALIWTPAGWWHEEMSLPGYHSIEIAGGTEIWTKSTEKYTPFPAFLVEWALNVWARLGHAEGRPLNGPETFSATGENCVSTAEASDPMTFCFDSFTGTLTSAVDSRWNVTARYLEYAPFGTKSFPRLMEVGRSGEKPFVAIRVVQLALEAKPDLRLFLPVKGAKQEHTEAACGKVQPAQLEKMVRPEYPVEAERAGITGVVKLYAEIGADGIARGMWPVNSAAPILTGAAINAVRQWRYQPRTCQPNGTKLPQIQLITIMFSSR